MTLLRPQKKSEPRHRVREGQLRDDLRALVGALRRSEERYRRIFEKVPAGVAVSTSGGLLLAVNERFAAILGHDGRSLAGRYVPDFIRAEDRQTCLFLMDGEQVASPVLHFVRASGATVQTNVTVTPIATDDGDVEQLVWLVEDVTAQHEAYERLALQARMLDFVGQAVIAIGVDGRIAFWNRFAETLYGWTASEAVGRPAVELMAVEETVARVQEMRDHLQGGERWSGEMVLRRRDGSSFPALVSGTPLVDADGKITGIVGVSQDITAQKQYEEELESYRQQLDVAQSLAHLGSYTFDLRSGHRVWSDELHRIFGFEPGAAPDLATADARIHPDEREAAISDRDRVLAEKKPFGSRYRIVLPSGEVRMIEGRGKFIFDENGVATKAIGAIQDVTERHTQELELHRRAVQQSVIANLGHAALGGESIDVLFAQATEIVTSLLDVELCNIFELAGSAFRCVGGSGWGSELDYGTLIAREDAAQSAFTIETLGPVIVDDALTETRFARSELLRRHDVRSGITVPITTANGTAWGILGAHTRTPRTFASSDVDYLRAIATMLGHAVERARVDRQLVLHAAQQTAIANVSVAAMSSIDDAVAIARGIAVEVLGADSAEFVDGKFTATSSKRHFTVEDEEFLQSLATILADAVARDNARRALAVSEERYRQVIEGASDIIFTMAPDGTFTALNAAFEHTTGWSAASWLGRTFDELVVPEDRPRAHALLHAGQNAAEITVMGVCRLSILSITTFPKIENGRTVAIHGFARDVTDTRHAEKERTELTRNLQLVLESTVDGIITIDLAGRCTMSNRAAAEILGCAPDAIIGTELHTLIHGPNAAHTAADCPILGVARTGPRRSDRGETFLRGDGSVVPVDYSAAPVIDDMIPIGVAVSFTDITDRRKLETMLEQANRLTSLGRLAATVAHEFNNVLMGISPFVEVLRRGKSVEAALGHIERAVKRGKRITEEILRFTQPAEPVRVAFDAAAWLDNVAVEARSLLPAHCALTYAVEEHDLWIDGDPHQLQQIFTNLILNARDAMTSGGGTLTLIAQREAPGTRLPFGFVESPERFAHFIVRDTGCGMSAETLRHIFEPLFTTKKNGNGLGLPVTHQVVRRHGGEIFVESTPGVGTSFHIFLPVATTRPAAMHDARPATVTAASRRILLVEDDPSVATGLTSLLEMEGVHVDLARCGADAMMAVRDDHDLVLLDVGLPDMEGTTVYTSIAARYPNLAVVFSTGHGDRTKLESILDRPNVGYLLKPYDHKVLLETIREVTSRSATGSTASAR